MNKGWIKLNRSLLEWEWYDDINVRILFLHLLLTVNYEDKKWRGLLIKKGSRITGRIQLSSECGISEQKVRTAIKKLVSTSELTIRNNSLGTIFTINNWNKYQSLTTDLTKDQPESNHEPTRDQPEANQTSTTTKETNKLKKERNILYTDGQFLIDWNEQRSLILNKPSNRNRIGHFESVANFKELQKIYTQTDFIKAMKGLFNQQIMPKGNEVMRTDPKHLLANFENYLTAFEEKNDMLYGEKPKKIIV